MNKVIRTWQIQSSQQIRLYSPKALGLYCCAAFFGVVSLLPTEASIANIT